MLVKERVNYMVPRNNKTANANKGTRSKIIIKKQQRLPGSNLAYKELRSDHYDLRSKNLSKFFTKIIATLLRSVSDMRSLGKSFPLKLER